MDILRKELTELLQTERITDRMLRLHLMKILGASGDRPYITYEEFLDWLDEDTLAEWVNGEVIMTSPASKKHQDICGFLYEIIKSFAKFKDFGEVIQPPFQMKLANSGREPDLIFVKKENRSRFKETYLDGPADLVVEIISPESIGRDRGDKFYEYEQAAIPEYWLIDPIRQAVDFYRLGKDKMYKSIATDSQSIYQSAVLDGFWIKTEWLWQEPLPDALGIIVQIVPDIFDKYRK